MERKIGEMTVQELIDELMKVEDKSKTIVDLTSSAFGTIKVIETPNEVEFINE